MKKLRAFTFIEVVFVVALLGVIASLGISMYERRTQEFKIEKTAVQMQQLLQAATAYYIDHASAWPPAINDARFIPYKPFGDTANQNPWGAHYLYTAQPVAGNKRFQVTTAVPTAALAAQVASRLPNAAVENSTSVLAEVTIPGFGRSEMRSSFVTRVESLPLSEGVVNMPGNNTPPCPDNWTASLATVVAGDTALQGIVARIVPEGKVWRVNRERQSGGTLAIISCNPPSL